MNIYSDEQNEIHQRMIDEAYKHLTSTGVRSMSGSKCLYGGSGCAFAPMIKDGEHLRLDDSEDINSISTVYENSPESLHDWARGACPNFANLLQSCHDSYDVYEESYTDSDFLNHFKCSIDLLCKHYGYDSPVVI